MCGKDLLEAAKSAPPIDVVFLDIYMPGENGVNIAESLREISPFTGIVFVTTSTDHAVDAFSLNTLHYLVKPVTFEGVTEAMHRLAQLRKKKRTMISLQTGSTSCSVYLDEISYIQSMGHAKELVLTNGKIIRLWTPMAELEKLLGENFLKLNRSTIVNMEHIEQMGTNACVLHDGTRLEFARRERTAVKTAYDNYLFDRLSKQNNPEVSL
ncbi:MAG: LytTR family DNA-binding domain-containing protein [Clostridiales bacterium]|nr:LytTR family DNA-binding domain-containing protein [Clostridiales bacterium]